MQPFDLNKLHKIAGDSGCLPSTAKVTIRFMSIDDIGQEVTVKELKEYWDSKEQIQISTPDGWRTIKSWWDKGFLPMVKITTKYFSTSCATSHFIQLANETWRLAEELEPGHKIITKNGVDVVTEVSSIDIAECYDFEVDHPNHRYWGDGISSHNSGKNIV